MAETEEQRLQRREEKVKGIAQSVLPALRAELSSLKVMDATVRHGYLNVVLGKDGKRLIHVGATAVKSIRSLMPQLGVWHRLDYNLRREVFAAVAGLKDPEVMREVRRLRSEQAVFEARRAESKSESRRDEMRAELRALIQRGKKVFGISRDDMVLLFQEELKLLQVEDVFQS